MNKIIQLLSIMCLLFSTTSCLKSGLEELPAFEDAEITRFRFEYRWIDNTNTFGQLEVVQMDVVSTVLEDSNTINCEVTVPEENENFSAAIREQVTLSNIVGYADISIAAIIRPIGNSPVLGVIEDFSQQNFEYEVTAADGETKKAWNINIVSFTK